MPVLAIHLRWFDGDKHAFATGEDCPIERADFSGMKMLAAIHFYRPAHGIQLGCQRNGLEIVNGHVAGERDHPLVAIHLTHGLIENCGDDAAMDMARRTLKATRDTKFALYTGVVRCFLEAQMQSVPVLRRATEAMVRDSEHGTTEGMADAGNTCAFWGVLRSLQMASILLRGTQWLLRDQLRNTFFRDCFVVMQNPHAAVDFQQFL